MAEIKRTFTAARMNKDLDERLVKNGEYRDAMNIQIRTTDGDAAGTVQNVQGNTLIAASYPSQGNLLFNPEVTNGKRNKCIGSISDEQANKCYFLMASPEFNVNFTAASTSETIGNDLKALADSGSGISKPAFNGVDAIVEVTSDNVASYVVVDFHSLAATRVMMGITGSINTNTLSCGLGSYLPFFRPDASIQLYASDGTELLDVGTRIITASVSEITLNKELPIAITNDSCSFLKIENERVLDFNQKNQITGINIVDDFLFFTDGISEPKKVNIRRGRIGSPRELSGVFALQDVLGDSLNQTKLILDNQLTGESVAISEIQEGHNDHLLQEHITVIRKAPRTAPNIIMSKTSKGNDVDFTVVTTDLSYLNPSSVGSEAPSTGEDIFHFYENIQQGQNLSGIGAATNLFSINNTVTNNESFNANLYSISVGDVVTLTSNNNQIGIPPVIRARIEDINDDGSTVLLLALDLLGDDVTIADITWHVVLELTKPFFEFKFPRFGYRYKYNDGEYSSFSPFSQVAFLPSDYDYEGKKGYNLGMTNTLRQLKVTNFLPEESMRPDDIDSVDILYKSTDSPVVYVIKTINRDIDPEWFGSSSVTTNEVLITSDMVYKALPSNQILRSFDNVPRFAQAQELIGNRIVYANYTQGFNTNFNPGLSVSLKEKPLQNILSPERSIKSIRNYKVGLVYGDKYGRETPVIAPGDRVITKTSDVFELSKRAISDSIYVEKAESTKSNKLTVKQHWGIDVASKTVPSWIDYVKFYVKETSGEYYNMLQHRWYNAEDGNIWLAFGSVDRNKVDEESYLVLKKKHGGNVFAKEDARYKILAIANEAPQFVKTTTRKVGLLNIQQEEINYDSVNNFEQGLSTRTEFTATNPEFFIGITGINPYFFEDFGISPGALDNLFVRVKASSRDNIGNVVNTAHTKYKRITGISGSSGDGVRFKIEEPFNEEAHFVSHFISIGDYVDDGTSTTAGSLGATGEDGVFYEFDFRLFVVENKPEFDGRFFVKIHKDALLDKYILGTVVGGDTFSVQKFKEYTLGFLDNNNKTNVATEGARASYVFGTHNDVASPINTSTVESYSEWVHDNAHLYENIISDPTVNFATFNQVTTDYGRESMRETADFWDRWRRRCKFSMFIDAGDAFAIEQNKDSMNYVTFQDEDQSTIDNLISNPATLQRGTSSDNVTTDIAEGTLAVEINPDDGGFSCDGNKRGFARSGTLTGSAVDHIDRIYFGIFKARGAGGDISSENNSTTEWLSANPTSIENDFYFTMSEPGTLFRFKSNPNLVYRVLGQDDDNFSIQNRATKLSGTILNFHDFGSHRTFIIENSHQTALYYLIL